MASKQKRYTKKHLHKMLTVTIFLFMLVTILTYTLLNSNQNTPKINELTASYISFNNLKSTDMLKISNIQKRTKKNGMTRANTNKVSFEVTGKKNKSYEIVLYPLGNQINNKDVYFYLISKSNKILNNLESIPTKEDGGKIIYIDKIDKKEKYTLYMWIDKKSDETEKNVSYEIKIK